jgi:hypothetical protein
MKNKLLTLAGALALLTILGTHYAKPLLAQVRAAVVKNIDEPARVPYQAQIICGGVSQCNLGANHGPFFSLPQIPDHSRLVIDQISLLIQTNGTLNIVKLGQFSPGFGESELDPLDPPLTFLPFSSTPAGYVVNQTVRYYFESGFISPAVELGIAAPVTGSALSVSMQGMVSGYVVDLSQ